MSVATSVLQYLFWTVAALGASKAVYDSYRMMSSGSLHGPQRD